MVLRYMNVLNVRDPRASRAKLWTFTTAEKKRLILKPVGGTEHCRRVSREFPGLRAARPLGSCEPVGL